MYSWLTYNWVFYSNIYFCFLTSNFLFNVSSNLLLISFSIRIIKMRYILRVLPYWPTLIWVELHHSQICFHEIVTSESALDPPHSTWGEVVLFSSIIYAYIVVYLVFLVLKHYLTSQQNIIESFIHLFILFEILWMFVIQHF